ncbi:vacuolar ATPase assembly integral membrane protein VMA21 homolog [Aphomia sociella]
MMIDGRANELPDFQVFRTVIKYCLVIIIVPVLSFFSVKVVLFDGILRLEPITSSVYSAVIAVVVLHVTLGLYIYRAYNEVDKPPPKPVKKD